MPILEYKTDDISSNSLNIKVTKAKVFQIPSRYATNAFRTIKMSN